jgi:perosamine synthetase
MLLTDSYDICARIRMFKDYGRIGRGSKELDTQVAQWGLNFRFTEMQAAIGLAQLTRLESRINGVKAVRSFYRGRLVGCEMPHSEEGNLPWVVDIQLPVAGLNLKLHESLKEKYGIETRLPYVPVHLLQSIEGRFPGAEYWSSRGLWLPTNPRLGNEELEYVVDSVNRELSSHMSAQR